MGAILELTDGTETVDLLKPGYGAHLVEWEPAAPPLRDGGVFALSAFKHGRRLTDAMYDNPIETLTLIVNSPSQDDLISLLRRLRGLLERGMRYWTEASTLFPPVYLRARGGQETQTRYAVVVAGLVEKDTNPYSQPFLQPGCKAATLVTVAIEHLFWADTPPGEATKLAASAARDAETLLDIALSNTLDDALLTPDYINQPVPDTDATTLYIGVGLEGTSNQVGLRFPAVLIPPQVEVKEAWLEVVGIKFTTHALSWQIRGVAADNPGRPLSWDDNPLRTAAWWARYELEGTRWNYGTVYRFGTGRVWDPGPPGLRRVLSELARRPGWASGNAMAFVLSEIVESPPGSLWNARAFAGVGFPELDPPKLHVAFDNPTPVGALDDGGDLVVANKHNRAQLTHVYVYDASEGTYTSAKPIADLDAGVDLLPATPAINDCLYFGISQNADNYGPFHSVAFNLAAPFVGNYNNTIWEFPVWDGTLTWLPLTLLDGFTDGSEGLTQTGVSVVSWDYYTAVRDYADKNNTNVEWIETEINGITGWWVRLRVSASFMDVVTPPLQTGREVFTAVVARCQVPAAALTGDLPALLRIEAENSYENDADTATSLAPTWLAMGSRSQSRGSLFCAYLPASQNQQPDGVTGELGTDASYISAGMRYYNGLAGAVEVSFFTQAGLAVRHSWIIDDPAAASFSGRFRLFARVGQVGGAVGDLKLQASVDIGPGPWLDASYVSHITSDLVTVTGTDFPDYQLIDLGQVSIPVDEFGKLFQVKINLLAQSDADESLYTLPILTLFDVVLLPADETFVISEAVGRRVWAKGLTIDLDSARSPRHDLLATVRSSDVSNAIAGYHIATAAPLTLAPNRDQDLWFLFATHAEDGGLLSRPWVTHKVRLSRVARYFTARGAA